MLTRLLFRMMVTCPLKLLPPRRFHISSTKDDEQPPPPPFSDGNTNHNNDDNNAAISGTDGELENGNGNDGISHHSDDKSDMVVVESSQELSEMAVELRQYMDEPYEVHATVHRKYKAYNWK